MLSMRALSRVLPRTTLRIPSPLLRPLTSYSRSNFLQSVPKPSRIPTYASFSTSPWRREPASDNDQELSAKLKYEIEIEQGTRDSSEIPERIQDYLDRSGFQIQDTPGTDVVTLTKTFDTETIKIEFHVDEINSLAEEAEDLDEDTALDDEDFSPSSSSPNTTTTTPQPRTINQAAQKGGPIDVAPEDSIAPADRANADGEEVDETESAAIPITFTATITKSGAAADVGAIVVQARAADTMIEVSEVVFYPTAKLADANTPEDARDAGRLYLGPPFSNLDGDLCSMFERYVDERGINSELAQFLPDYVDYKEQREYVQWLGNVKKFIDT